MIILQCVKSGSKLRIRFHSFIDENNKIFNNVYNCQFPKDIREDGRFYLIKDKDMSLQNNNGTPFYKINNNITFFKVTKTIFM